MLSPDLYGLEIIFSDSSWVDVLASPSNIEIFVLAILGSLGAFVGTMVTVLIFLLFIILEEHTIAKRFNAAFPQSSGRARNIVHDSMESISAYVVSKVTCSGGQAIVMTIIISPVGFDIPGWFLFGVLCFLLDFIPILGALFATIPPVLIGFIMLEPLDGPVDAGAPHRQSADVWLALLSPTFRVQKSASHRWCSC